MAFQIITDPDKLAALCDAGLLWWVGGLDGGCNHITTFPVTKGQFNRKYFAHPERSPCFGILTEE